MGTQAQGAAAHAELSTQGALGVLGKGGQRDVAGVSLLTRWEISEAGIGSGPSLPAHLEQCSMVPSIPTQIQEPRNLVAHSHQRAQKKQHRQGHTWKWVLVLPIFTLK